jgi:hypothetical protein
MRQPRLISSVFPIACYARDPPTSKMLYIVHTIRIDLHVNPIACTGKTHVGRITCGLLCKTHILKFDSAAWVVLGKKLRGGKSPLLS